MATKTEILLNSVKFNKLTRKQYNKAKAAGQINENEFYITGETLDEGDMLKSEYDSIFAGKELTLTGESIELKDSSEDRISSVTVNGYTIQNGSGNQSPNNVREIENAGEFNAYVTITGKEAGWFQYTDLNNGIVTYVCENIAPGWTSINALKGFCSAYKVQNVMSDAQALRGPTSANPAGTIIIRDDSVSTLQAFKAKIAELKLVVTYLSTENTGEYYTGVEIFQDNKYQCEIIRLRDRLHDGDKVETNSLGIYDTELIITGEEDNLSFNSNYNMLNITGILTAGDTVETNIYGMVASSRIPQIIPGMSSVWAGIFSQPKYSQICIQDTSKSLWTDKASAIQLLKDWNASGDPLRIFYKSALKKSSINIKQEEYIKSTQILTGTETLTSGTAQSKPYFALTGVNVKAPSSQNEIGSVKCNMLTTVAQSDVINGNYRICNSTGGNFLLHFTDDITTVEQVKQILAEKYAAGTPFVIEYELKNHKIYVDEPVKIKNPKGTFTISGEKNTSLNVNLKSITDSNKLNGYDWYNNPNINGFELEEKSENNNIEIECSENRIKNIKIDGFTTQSGSGDPSLTNIRPIKNAAELNKVFTFDGTNATFVKIDFPSQPNLLVFDVNISNVVKSSEGFSTWLPMPKGFDEQNGKEGIRAFSASSGFKICVYKSRLSGETVDAFNTYLKANPLTIAYQSTENTSKFYTGVEVKQDDSYHCDIVELKDRLHSGDRLETNVQSEYDLEYTFDGTEAWSKASTTYEHWWKLYIQLNLFEKGVQASNDYPSRTLNQIYTNRGCYINADTIFFNEPSANTVEEFKAILAQKYAAGTPVKLFAKSQAGGTLKNIKREKHVKKTLVLTGTENVQDDPGWIPGVIAVLQKMTDAVQVDGYGTVANITCSHLKVDTPNNIASIGHVACGQGAGSKLFLYFGSQYNTTELTKEYLAQQYAAGTPVTVEYDLAAPEVYADEPIEIKNPNGKFMVSAEENTKISVSKKPLTDANFLNGRTWNDVEDYVDNKISSSSGSSVTGVKGNAETSYRKGNVNLTPANIGALSSSGGNFLGWLVGNADNVGMTWTSADGTIFRVKTYKPGNVCQITRKIPGKAEEGVLNIYSNSASFKGNSDTATKVNNNLIVKLNSGTSEGTNMFTFNGSTAKTVNITPSAIGAEPTITTKNTAFNKNFGTAAGTVCQGNDSRLSDARRSSNISMSRSGTTLYITYS